MLLPIPSGATITANFPPVCKTKECSVLRVPPSSPLAPRSGFSVPFCSTFSSAGRRGETHQLQKALCPPESENTLALFPPFVRLPPTCTQHERESFPCLQLSTKLRLCLPRPTQQNATEARREPLHRSGSFICWKTRSPPSRSSFLFYRSLPRQHNLRPSLELVTSPNTHITVTSSGGSCSQGHRATCWWRGQLIRTLCLGQQGATAEGKLLEAIKPPPSLISGTSFSKICIC